MRRSHVTGPMRAASVPKSPATEGSGPSGGTASEYRGPIAVELSEATSLRSLLPQGATPSRPVAGSLSEHRPSRTVNERHQRPAPGRPDRRPNATSRTGVARSCRKGLEECTRCCWRSSRSDPTDRSSRARPNSSARSCLAARSHLWEPQLRQARDNPDVVAKVVGPWPPTPRRPAASSIPRPRRTRGLLGARSCVVPFSG
jgi:hypothetical protein